MNGNKFWHSSTYASLNAKPEVDWWLNGCHFWNWIWVWFDLDEIRLVDLWSHADELVKSQSEVKFHYVAVCLKNQKSMYTSAANSMFYWNLICKFNFLEWSNWNWRLYVHHTEDRYNVINWQWLFLDEICSIWTGHETQASTEISFIMLGYIHITKARIKI